jgi:hypothetical protein
MALAALLISGAGCSKKQTTAPLASDPLSPATQAGIGSISAALQSPAWSKLDGLSFAPAPAATATAMRAMLRAAQPGMVQAQQASGALVRDILNGWSSRLATPNAVVIPAEVRGTTWVFDPAQHKYVVDASRTGAPENGVRYILYAVNPLSHEPVVDAEIGYADLTDEGDDTPNTASLRLRAVSDDVVFVDYAATITRTDTGGEIQASGAFFYDAKHLSFDIQVQVGAGPDQAGVDLHARLEVPEDSAQLETGIHVTADPVTGRLAMTQNVEVCDHTFTIEASGSNDEAHATIVVDGTAFAQIHQTANVVVVVGADGRPLPPDQRKALGQIFTLFADVSAAVGRLLQPVGVLFALVPAA